MQILLGTRKQNCAAGGERPCAAIWRGERRVVFSEKPSMLLERRAYSDPGTSIVMHDRSPHSRQGIQRTGVVASRTRVSAAQETAKYSRGTKTPPLWRGGAFGWVDATLPRRGRSPKPAVMTSVALHSVRYEIEGLYRPGRHDSRRRLAARNDPIFGAPLTRSCAAEVDRAIAWQAPRSVQIPSILERFSGTFRGGLEPRLTH